MSAELFVNLPLKDLNKSIDFFTQLGYKFNDETATCMIVSVAFSSCC
jgi:predicted lactoylglutathione lyase